MAKLKVVTIIVNLSNLCFSTGIFPIALKRSIFIPVYKNGDKNNINNYRPISVLPSISKILEKLLNKRLTKYQRISNSQYGFRQGKSREETVIAITSYICELNTISAPILIRKLESIGIASQTI